ncbi:hypothetical protein CNMCM7927_000531 [Aspergillus lentulus]|nr:hypothetical protein CNMCM7927_000531 [Aspergillus lentulus]
MESNLSLRGRTLAAQKPVFLDVLGDIWDPSSNPDGVVNIGLAENTLMHQEMKEFMNSKLHVDSHALTYGDGFSGSRKLKGALCHFLNRHFHPRVALSHSQLTITSGVSNAVECCAWALSDHGDYILIGRPYFNAFKPTFGIRAGVGLLEVKFGMTDPFSLDAVQEYEKTYEEARSRGIRVKALLLCSPHNPLGRCYSEDVLREYMKFCNKHKLHLISDEIYALSVWENNDLPGASIFKSVLSMDIDNIMDPSMVHVVWGLSKDFGATGLRIGCLISQSNMSLLEAADGISLYNFPSSLADSIAASVLLDDEFSSKYIATNQRRLGESYRFVTDFLTLHDIPYYKSNAAIFVWMNLAAVLRDKSIKDADILKELQRQKVYIAAGYAYASEEAGWFRMVFAHSQSVLEEGLNLDSPVEWDKIVVDGLEAYRQYVTPLNQVGYETDSERDALVDIQPKGFFIRQPPLPHELDTYMTPDAQLFQTIHMGAAVVDPNQWRLIVDGMVLHPFMLNLRQLQSMPRTSITTFHECYGSPLLPPTRAVRRVGNVRWTGVRLRTLLQIARPQRSASYVWSEGLDGGIFANVWADRYQKDLPLEKAIAPEVLLAFEINGAPLDKERGGPVRLVVPGWYGTNSTKWISHISLQDKRATGPFTTLFYNEIDPADPDGQQSRPVWKVEPNSIIVRPRPGATFASGHTITVIGRAWACEEIVQVEISTDGGNSLCNAQLTPRREFEWQLFQQRVVLSRGGLYTITARATDKCGQQQPLSNRRNLVSTDEPRAERLNQGREPAELQGVIRSMEANSGAAFIRRMGLKVDPANAPKLNLFGWNIGPRQLPSGSGPICAYPIVDILSRTALESLASVYFSKVHPCYGFIDRQQFYERVDARWGSPLARDQYDSVLSGVAALGSLFSELSPTITELHLVEAARSILDVNGLSGAPSLDFVAGWTLRVVYMRMTATPHSAWIASSTLMHLIEAAGLHLESSFETVLSSGTQCDQDLQRRLVGVAQHLNMWISYDIAASNRPVLLGFAKRWTMGAIFSTIRRICLDLSAVISELNQTKHSFDSLLARISSATPPVPNPSISYWQEDPPFPNLVAVQSPDLPTTADIVVIGSGISGASVAYTILTQFDKRGISPEIVVLEARDLCSGATGRNGGHMKCSPYVEYAGLKARFGVEHAKKLLGFQRRNLAAILDFVRRNQALKASEAREVQTVDVFTDERMWVKAKKMVQELRQDAPDMAEDIVVHDGTEACEELHIDPQHCYGIITYKAGALWPYRFVTSLYASLLSTYSATFSIETNTPVTAIQVNSGNVSRPFTVQTPRGHITAAHVVHATDAFAANLLPGLKGKIFPVRGHVTAQNPGTLFPKLGGARSWSFIHRRGFDYVSQRPGTGELIAGGGLVQSPEKGMDEFGIWRDDRSSFAIRAYLDGLLPTMFGVHNWGADIGARVKMAWTGCMGFTPDLLPYVGILDQKITQRKVPTARSSKDAKHPAEWISAGFQGEGMVLAWLSGVAVGLMLVGEDDEVFEQAPGIPGGKIGEWLPEEFACSKQRVDYSNVSDLATLL